MVKAATPSTKSTGTGVRTPVAREAAPAGQRRGGVPADLATEFQRTIGNQAVLRRLRRDTGASPLPGPTKFAKDLADDRLEREADEVAEAFAGAKATDLGDRSQTSRAATVRLKADRTTGPMPRLTINRPGDSFEQEADRVAEYVMRITDRHATPQVAAAHPGVQRKCDCGGTCSKCQGGHETGDQPLQIRADAPHGPAQATAPPLVHQALRSPGQPLDGGTRSFMEGRFGRDLSPVRLHADATAAQSARAIQARAYTAGHDIVFGAGQFSPTSRDSLKLLAHELTHVIQQSEGGAPAVQRQPDAGSSAAMQRPLPDMKRQMVASRAKSDLRKSHDPLKEMQRCIEGCLFSTTEERRLYAKYFLTEYYQSLDGGADSMVVDLGVIDAEQKFQATRSAKEVDHIPDTAGTMAWVDEQAKSKTKRGQERNEMIERGRRVVLFERQKAEIDQLTSGIPVDWLVVAMIARSIGRKRPDGYYAALGRELLDETQPAVDNIQKRANQATAAASADNQKQLAEDLQVLRDYIDYYREHAAKIRRLSTAYNALEKQWDQEPKERLIDGRNYEERLLHARWAGFHAHLDTSQHFDRLTPQQVFDSGEFNPLEKDRVFADQNDLIGEAERKSRKDDERVKVQAQIEQEDRFIGGMEAAKHNELFLQPFGAGGMFMGLYNAAQIGALGGSIVNSCREGVGECLENAGPAIVIGVVTHKAMKWGSVRDPVPPVPDPSPNVLPTGVAGSQDPVFWSDPKTTSANPTVRTLAPGERPITDISAARKQTSTAADPKPETGIDTQRAQVRMAVGQNVPLDPAPSTVAPRPKVDPARMGTKPPNPPAQTQHAPPPVPVAPRGATPRVKPPKAGGITVANFDKVVGMKQLLNRLNKLNGTFNSLGFETPEELADFLDKNPRVAIEELNRRVDMKLEQLANQQAGKQKPDVAHTSGGPEKKWSREEVLGGTPGKDSGVGLQVQARMRSQGKLVGQGDQIRFFDRRTQQWHPIKDAQMGHTTDAVTWWKEKGYFYGRKSDPVRAWQNDPNNYELEYGPENLREGAGLKDRYVAEHPDPITPDELAGKVKPR